MKNGLFTLVLCIFLCACGKTVEIDSLTKNIEKIENNQFYFDCTEEVNKSDNDSRNSLGYLCSVIINEDTKMKSNSNQELKITDFSVGDSIKVNFNSKVNISDKNRTFEVTDVTLLE
ncbi:hypothetical protein [Paenibacillus sp. KS-LC4]|uniref:hypothetical protein n=1 Tax=Paenibacillus sp. KS-LC4 TaxID=2979727 RepID=UPI0030D5D722